VRDQPDHAEVVGHEDVAEPELDLQTDQQLQDLGSPSTTAPPS
jgi:hypothetical protein